eukprot:scaffold12862_cov102-Cyclotella_meneghiniana.AAC.5
MNNRNNAVTFASIELERYHIRIVAEEAQAFKDLSIESLAAKLTNLQISFNRDSNTCKVASLGEDSAEYEVTIEERRITFDEVECNLSQTQRKCSSGMLMLHVDMIDFDGIVLKDCGSNLFGRKANGTKRVKRQNDRFAFEKKTKLIKYDPMVVGMFSQLLLRQNENDAQSRPMTEEQINYIIQELKNQWTRTSSKRQKKFPTKVQEAFNAFVGKDGVDPTTSRLHQLAPEALQTILMNMFSWERDRDRICISSNAALCILGSFDMLEEFYESLSKYQLKNDPKRMGTYENGQMRKIPNYTVGTSELNLQGCTKMEDPDFPEEEDKEIWKFLGKCLKVHMDWYFAHFFIECYKLKDRLAAGTKEAKWIAELQQGYLTSSEEVSHLDGLTVKKGEFKDCNAYNCCLEPKLKNQWRRGCKKRYEENGVRCVCVPPCIYPGAPTYRPHLEIITSN